MIIRPAQMDDLDTLLTFEQGVITAERPYDPTLKEDPITYYDIHDLIHSPLAEILVAEIDNQLVGCGYAKIKEAKPNRKHRQFAYLGFMYVIPHYRGKGINQAILTGLIQWTRQQGLHELRLEVYVGNGSALKAYTKAGFMPLVQEMRLDLSTVDDSM